MAYTPTNWVTGDTVTASAMNKMENGIANAGSLAIVRFSASGYNTSSKTFGYIAYAYFENSTWQFATDDLGDEEKLFGFAAPQRSVAVITLPNDDTIGAFIVLLNGSSMENTGGVSNVPTTVYFSYGSNLPCFRITGNGTAEFVY